VPNVDEPRPGEVVTDRYRLDGLIARGGMAVVWSAHDVLLDRRVAVKFPLGPMRSRPEFLARFRREAVAAARLNHPHVVAVYDTGDDPALGPFIVMELVPGPSLRQILKAEGNLSVDRAVDIAGQVATALDFAHSRGVVHRDVKPANILIDDGRVKVVDFGIAKAAAADDLTQTDVTLGTARYISPEQVDGRPLDARSDVYALGIVLYEMLCGHTPFDADNDLALAMKHLADEVPLPSLTNPDIPAWLDGVVLTALAKSPDDRYQSAVELRQALLDRGRVGPVLPPQVAATSTQVAPTPVPASEASGAPTRAVGLPANPTRAFAGVAAGAPAAEAAASSPGPSWAAAAVVDAPATPPPFPVADPARPPSGPPTSRRRVPTGALLAAAGAVAVAGAVYGGVVAMRGGNGGGSSPGAAAAAGPTPLRIVGAEAFNPPPGDGHQHDEELGHLYDHDPATYWETEHYASAAFGNLKPGVGVILQLGQSSRISEMSVISPTQGWTYKVYESDSTPDTLAGWGSPVTGGTVSSTTTTINLGGKPATNVLLWITYLGDGNSQVRIGEVSLSS